MNYHTRPTLRENLPLASASKNSLFPVYTFPVSPLSPLSSTRHTAKKAHRNGLFSFKRGLLDYSVVETVFAGRLTSRTQLATTSLPVTTPLIVTL